MKIEIQQLKRALFSSNLKHLDKSTGKFIFLNSMTKKMYRDHARYMHLPTYSQAYVRQQYMTKMSDEKMLPEWGNLSSYPKFKIVQKHPFNKEKRSYCGSSYSLCDKYKFESTEYDVPGQVREHETFVDFADRMETELAKKWCEENGFDYYDSEDIPPSEEEQELHEKRERKWLEDWYKFKGDEYYDRETYVKIMDDEIKKMRDHYNTLKANWNGIETE